MNTSVLKNLSSKKKLILFELILFVVIAVATVFFAAPQTTALAYTSTNGGSMSSGSSVSVSLSSSVAVKYYSFTPSTTATYEFTSGSNSGDPYFYLVSADQLNSALSSLNSSGCRTSITNLTYNDDGNGSLNFKASYYCYAGTTYYLLFTRYNTNATSYTAYVSGTTRYTFTLNNQSATTAGTTTLYMEYTGSSYNYIIGAQPLLVP
jgi:hypothetical protein